MKRENLGNGGDSHDLKRKRLDDDVVRLLIPSRVSKNFIVCFLLNLVRNAPRIFHIS